MRTISKSVIAAGLAATTVLSGLSFGSSVALAAPTTDSPGTAADDGWSEPFKLVFKDGARYFGIGSTHNSNWYFGSDVFNTAQDATAAGAALVYNPTTKQLRHPNGWCAQTYPTQMNSIVYAGDCDASRVNQKWDFVDGKMVSVAYPSSAIAGYVEASKAMHINGGTPFEVVSGYRTTAPLTASVTRVNDIARSAELAGTATKGADVSVGNTSVKADTTTGAWTMTVDGLAVGQNTLEVVQKLDGREVDRKTLDVTVIEGGTLVPGTTSPVTLERGTDTVVPFTVENLDTRSDMVGTVELHAPAGTTFVPGQTTVAAGYRKGDSGTWRPYAPLNLTGGVASDGNTTLRFRVDTGGGNMVAGEQYRYELQVRTPADAAAGTSSMNYTYEGMSSIGDYRAQGSTTTVLDQSTSPLTAHVDVVNHIAGSVVVSGTATPKATVSIGTAATEVSGSGAWSLTVDGLSVGSNALTVVQTIGDREVDEKRLDVTIIEGGTLVPGTSPRVNLMRGTNTPVPFIVENNETRSGMTGTVTLTAPANTTFTPGQATITAEHRTGDTGAWVSQPGVQLVNGRLGDSGRTITFDTVADRMDAGEQFRYTLSVATPADATAGLSGMSYVYTGVSSAGDHEAAGRTTTIIEEAAPVIRDLAVTSPTSNSTISAPAGDTPQFPNAKVTFTGTGEPQATIEIARHNGKAAGSTVVDPKGNWTAYVDANWVNYPFFTVIQTAGSDVQTQRVENVTVVREGQSRDFAVTSVASGGTITAPAGTTPDFPNAQVPFAGDGAVGATVKVFRQNGALAGSTVVQPDGHWALDTNFNWGKWDIKVTQTIGSDAPTEIQLQSVSIVKDGVVKPFQVTSPLPNTTVVAEQGSAPQFPNAQLNVTGEGASGATVVLTRPNGKSAGSGIVQQDGTFSFDADVNWGTWSFTATQTALDGTKTPISLPNVTVVQDSVDLPFGVTAPTDGATLTLPRDGAPGFENARVVFTGTGKAGDEIEVLRLHNSKTAGRGTVDRTGHWTVDADYNFGTWGAKVLVNGQLAQTIDSFTIVEAI